VRIVCLRAAERNLEEQIEYLYADQSVALFGNSSNQIINNTGCGILCTGAPSNPLIYSLIGTFGTVSGNGAGQIACNVSP